MRAARRAPVAAIVAARHHAAVAVFSRIGSALAVVMLAAGCPADDGSVGDDGGSSSTGEVVDGSTGTRGTSGVDSTGGGPGGTGSDGGSDETGPGVDPAGCKGVDLLDNPADPAAPGPWPVGVQTVDIDGRVVEVWYPAQPGSEAGLPTVQYDIREQLPASEADKIPDEENPWQDCDCYRDLPVDDAHGPYPAVFFIHGTASFRTQSVEQMTHWASRGFVVLAADHPGLKLGDLLGMICGGPSVSQDLTGDVQAMMAAARGDAPGLDLAANIDATRFAVSGHSAGGNATSQFSNDAQVLMPLAAGGVMPGTAVVSTLIMGAMQDSVVPYSGQLSGYDSSPAPKRLVGIENQGHLAFSSLCYLQNDAGEDLLTIANNNGVCGVQFADVLFQCDDTFLDPDETMAIVNFATAATLEETLQCSDIGAAFANLQAEHPAVGELLSEPPL